MIATASPANHDFLRELGADPLDYHDGDLPARVRELTGDGGADAALDLFGGDGREQAFASLRSGGRLASIAAPPPEPRDGYEAHYVFVRPSGDDLRELAELVDDGQLRPHVEEVFPLERAADAHERIEGGHVRGKLVLSVPAEDQRPDRAQQRERRAERLDEEAHARARLGLVVGAPDQPGLVEVGQVDGERDEQRDHRQHEAGDRRRARAAAHRAPRHRHQREPDRPAARSRGGRPSTCCPPSGTAVIARISYRGRNSATISSSRAEQQRHQQKASSERPGTVVSGALVAIDLML